MYTQKNKSKTKKHMLVMPKFYSLCSFVCSIALSSWSLCVVFVLSPRYFSLHRFSLCCVVVNITFIRNIVSSLIQLFLIFRLKFTHAYTWIFNETSSEKRVASCANVCARSFVGPIVQMPFENGSLGIKCGCCADTHSPQTHTLTLLCSELCQREHKKKSAHFPANLVHVCRLV